MASRLDLPLWLGWHGGALLLCSAIFYGSRPRDRWSSAIHGRYRGRNDDANGCNEGWFDGGCCVRHCHVLRARFRWLPPYGYLLKA